MIATKIISRFAVINSIYEPDVNGWIARKSEASSAFKVLSLQVVPKILCGDGDCNTEFRTIIWYEDLVDACMPAKK